MEKQWTDYLKKNATEWLLESDVWIRYRTLVDLLDRPESDPEVMDARKKMLENEQLKEFIKETSKWFPELPKRHDDARMSHYKLRMLADFGYRHDDEGIEEIIEQVKAHKENNLFAIRQELPEKNSNKDTDPDPWHALPCDSPLITYTLLRLGDKSKDVMDSVDILLKEWEKPEGWFCHLFFVNGQYKKYNSGCPMAGLMFLELMSVIDEHNAKKYLMNGYAPLEFHRDYGKSLYYFGRARRFWSFKYPFVWYNALYVGDVLSRFEIFKKEELLKEIIDWIVVSQDDEGCFKPTSMFREYQGWEFANKKEASPWITFLAYRILKRYYDHN